MLLLEPVFGLELVPCLVQGSKHGGGDKFHLSRSVLRQLLFKKPVSQYPVASYNRYEAKGGG